MHENNKGKVNRSLNRLEVQNKNFLKQMQRFRHERTSVQKESSSNLRALSGLSSHMGILSQAGGAQSTKPLGALSGVGSLKSIQ